MSAPLHECTIHEPGQAEEAEKRLRLGGRHRLTFPMQGQDAGAGPSPSGSQGRASTTGSYQGLSLTTQRTASTTTSYQRHDLLHLSSEARVLPGRRLHPDGEEEKERQDGNSTNHRSDRLGNHPPPQHPISAHPASYDTVVTKRGTVSGPTSAQHSAPSLQDQSVNQLLQPLRSGGAATKEQNPIFHGQTRKGQHLHSVPGRRKHNDLLIHHQDTGRSRSLLPVSRPHQKDDQGSLDGLPSKSPTRPDYAGREGPLGKPLHVQRSRQVLIEFEGPLPGHLDMGVWGIFYLRPYTPEPLRCYHCQAYGHARSQCRNPARCGICSSPHDTDQCLQRYKSKEDVTHRCPNCGGNHHAWNKACPERRRRVQQGIEAQSQWVQNHCNAPQGTFVWGTQNTPKQQATQSPLLTADFPPLPTQAPIAPPPPQSSTTPVQTPQELTIALTTSSLKTLLSDFALTLSQMLKQDLNQAKLTAAVDCVVNSHVPTPATPPASQPAVLKPLTTAAVQEHSSSPPASSNATQPTSQPATYNNNQPATSNNSQLSLQSPSSILPNHHHHQQ